MASGAMGRYANAMYLIGGAACLAAAPVVRLAGQNLDFLDWGDFWLVLLVTVALTTGVVGLLALALPRHLGLAAAVALLSVSWGYLPKLAPLVAPLLSALGVPLLLLALLCTLLFVLSVVPQGLLARATAACGGALLALAVVQTGWSIAMSMSRGSPASIAKEAAEEHLRDPLPRVSGRTGKLPDIVYIVPDRYAGRKTLEKHFGHDNGSFIEKLEERGFFVAEDSRANYLKTHYSLASSLNMQYTEEFMRPLDAVRARSKMMYGIIETNRVVARLKELGYRYVHVPSWFDGTRRAAQADSIVDFWEAGVGGEFGRIALKRNLLVVLALTSRARVSECSALKQQLSYLEAAGGDAQPTFVFAHVIAPHDPILVDAGGTCRKPLRYPRKGVSWAEFTNAYSDYVTYINGRLLEIFDRQTSENPNDVIFVIQADEGPFPQRYREAIAEHVDFDWREQDLDTLNMKFDILNALFFPKERPHISSRLTSALSPVNNWRIIFSYLEDVPHELLPNRQHIYPPDRPYKSIDITSRLAAGDAARGGGDVAGSRHQVER